MEQVHGTDNVSEEDVISKMPENVITNILDRLPIKDAVRTGILSTNWRFNWNMLTRLVFDRNFFGKSNQNHINIISRILLQLKGSITKFHLRIPYYKTLDVEEVGLWVMVLSRKGITDFTLLNYHETPFKLPTHLFACLQLKHLKLNGCYFHSPPTFCGFPNLLSLHLYKVTDIDNCVEFITKCPLLEILNIIDFKPIGKVKLVEIAKLKNLKVLSLPLCMFDDLTITSAVIFQLGDYLPQLEELTLDFEECNFIGEEEGETCARKSVHIIFPCLETLELCGIDLNIDSMLTCAIEMITGSPNLKSLTIVVQNEVNIPPTPYALTYSKADYDTLGQLQLRNLSFKCYGSENDVCLIKYLLASSPLLKTVLIYSNYSFEMSNENLNLMFAAKLLMLRRASPLVEVKLIY